MQRDIEPNEIDWVFCWRTSTGEVRGGARDTSMNGRRVPYQPSAVSLDAGLRTIVRGRVRTCPLPPTGPRLDSQGSISRMCCFVWGHVTRATVVPARTERELQLLMHAARVAVLSGDASEWALASIGAREQERWGLHIQALPEVVSILARRIDAPWTLDVREKDVGTWVKGAQIFCRDHEGRVTDTLEADAVFDAAPLPAFAGELRPTANGEEASAGPVEILYARPTGPGAWERWTKPERG